MWNSTGGFQGGEHGNAGFMDSPSQFASPAGQGKKERRTNNIVPVTVRTIHQSEGDSVMINGNDIKMVVIVGIIQTVEVSSTKINYTIDDTTGVIEAVQWSTDSEFDDNAQKPLMEMTYCRIIATIKTQMGKKHAMILKIEPITDLNRLTTHLLEVIHDPLKLEFINNKQINGGSLMDQSSNPGNHMPGRLAGATHGVSSGGASSDHSSGLDGVKKMVFKYIQQSTDEAGAGRDSIYSTFNTAASHQILDDAVEFLTNEGHIYSTIDDDHFKTTDGF